MERNRITQKMYLLLTTLCFLPIITQAESICDYKKWDSFSDVNLFKGEDSYFFMTSHKAVDADGAPNAYHPDNIGLDYLENAGYPKKSWWRSVLVPDPVNPNVAYRQKEGEYKGFFISKTSLYDSAKDIYDTTRYVDATRYPYLVFPRTFFHKKGTGLLGDLGYALNLESGKVSPFVVADIGPSRAALGEISMNLAQRLGGKDVNPRNGAGIPSGDVLYVIYPYSSKQHKWPIEIESLEGIANAKIAAQGGVEAITKCAKKRE